MKEKILLLLCLILVLNIDATNYYVSNSGSNSSDGLTPGTAFLTIQTASNLVIAGDCVLVANGNYAGFNHSGLADGTISQPIVYKAIGNNVRITTGVAHGHNAINVENNN